MAEIIVFHSTDDIGLDPENKERNAAIIQRWLDRGDGCVVYENHDLGHYNLGHRVFYSFGSAQAQIPGFTLSLRCPDIGKPMWQYYLVGYIPPKDHEVEVKR